MVCIYFYSSRTTYPSLKKITTIFGVEVAFYQKILFKKSAFYDEKHKQDRFKQNLLMCVFTKFNIT